MFKLGKTTLEALNERKKRNKDITLTNKNSKDFSNYFDKLIPRGSVYLSLSRFLNEKMLDKKISQI